MKRLWQNACHFFVRLVMACLTHMSDSTFMRGELLNHAIYAASMIDLMVHNCNGGGKLRGFGPWIA